MKTYQKHLVAALAIASACSVRTYAETATEPETVLNSLTRTYPACQGAQDYRHNDRRTGQDHAGTVNQ